MPLADAPRLGVRFRAWVGLNLLPVRVFFGADESAHRDVSPSVGELANKGTDGLFRAWRNNKLDYEKCYRMLPWPDVRKELAAELLKSGSTAETLAPSEDAQVHGPKSNGPADGVRSSKLPEIQVPVRISEAVRVRYDRTLRHDFAF